MLWDPTFKPQLRPVEAFPVSEGERVQIGLRDRSGLSEVVLSVSGAALQIMGFMDGTTTCEEIRRKFVWRFGQQLSVDALARLMETLDQAHFLEGPGFESYYQGLLREYRSTGVRPMPHAEVVGLLNGSTEPFKRMLDGIQVSTPPRRVQGLIAPHLDYARGEPCYVAAYGALRGRQTPGRVVILGTNHFGRSPSVVATVSRFATPLGTTHTDVELLDALERQFGNLRTYELDHLREHSVELQVMWLQYLFGAENFRILPLLCPDPCVSGGTSPADGKGVDLAVFGRALGELATQDGGDTLIVAGADLSHVGGAFGDERALDDAFLEEVRRRDMGLLDDLLAGGASSFVSSVARDGNATRVCSAGCIFVLATAMPEATRTLLRYHQAVDQPTQTCVGCAAIVFT